MSTTVTDQGKPAAVRERRTRRPRRLRPYLLGEIAVVLLLVRVYDVVKHAADQKTAVGLRDAGHVRSLERHLHLGWELSVNRWLSHHHVLSLVASYYYQFAHESITLGVLAACWWLRPLAYRAARNALVAVNVVGLTVFALYPVAPPRLLPRAGFTDSVADAGFGSTHGGAVSADQFAAMPSLHLAWATWTAVVVYRWVRPPWARALCVAYPVWMTFVVVGTANHYLLDVVAGVAVAAMCLLASEALTPRLLARRLWPARRRHGHRGTPCPTDAPPACGCSRHRDGGDVTRRAQLCSRWHRGGTRSAEVALVAGRSAWRPPGAARTHDRSWS